MSSDVVGGRGGARRREPPLGQPDEHAGEAAGTRGEVLMAPRAGLACEVDDDRDHELRFDRVEKPRFGFELLARADDLEHHA